MDLEGLAEDLEGTAARQAVSQWLAELDAEPDGRTVVSHIGGEANLPLYGEGRDAIRRFVHAAAARRSGNPLGWYRAALKDSTLDLAIHGPAPDATLPDEICKIMNAWAVWNRLGGVFKPPIPPAAFRSPACQGAIEDWIRAKVCSARYQDELEPTQKVSGGEAPSVFSTFEEDRESKFPHGTPANRCREIVGLDPLDPPEAHVLLRYSEPAVGPARVPTALDAGTHLHFLPPPAGAGWGTTKDLGTPTRSGGVREVVVRPFPVSALRQPVFIDKRYEGNTP